MKLAEALIIRGEKQDRINNMEDRILSYLKVQEGDKTPEDPVKLLEEIFSEKEDLKDLIIKINQTNNKIKLDKDKTISEALVERNMIMEKRKVLNHIIDEAREVDYRLSHTEIRTIITMDIGKVQKELDKLSKEFRELDLLIQAKNWEVDLIE